MNNASNIIEYDEFQSKIDELKDRCNFIPDVSNDEGYQKSKRLSLDVGKVITAVEKKRVLLKADALEFGRKVDAEAKSIKEKLEEIRLPHKDAYKELDDLKKEREQKRKQEIEQRIHNIQNLAINLSESSSEEIKAAMRSMQDEQCTDFFEYTQAALKARNKAREDLAELFTKTLAREKEKLELERLRKLEAERERQQREDDIRRQASEKAEAEKLEALERERIASEKLKAAEQEAANSAKKALAEEKERQQRLAEKEKEALRIRESNRKHVGAIRKSAKEALMTHGLSEDIAKSIVLAINNGDIPNVKIIY